MATVRDNLPLIVITGPTASGKTALAIKLAKKYNGEIICADSRTVYKGMDIGTAKPTLAEQAEVPHWGLDLVEPGEPFSVAQFKKYAVQKIAEIRARGRMPFLVGGTGLYIDATIFDYQFGKKSDINTRIKLETKTVEELIQHCSKNNIKLPENKLNKRRLIRSIEQNGINNNRRSKPIENCIVVGISTERLLLRKRVKERVEQFFEDNVVKEAKILGKIYGWNSEAMTGNIYQIMYSYLNNNITLEEAKEKTFYKDWHLVKKQLTWMRRNKYINWLSLYEAEHFLSHEIARLKKI